MLCEYYEINDDDFKLWSKLSGSICVPNILLKYNEMWARMWECVAMTFLSGISKLDFHVHFLQYPIQSEYTPLRQQLL